MPIVVGWSEERLLVGRCAVLVLIDEYAAVRVISIRCVMLSTMSFIWYN